MDKETTLFLKTKILDLKTGRSWIVVLHANDARENGIYAGNKVVLKWGKKETEATVDLTTDLVQPGEIGLLKDVIEKYPIKEGEIIEIYLAPSPSSLEAIRKKIKGATSASNEFFQKIHFINNDFVFKVKPEYAKHEEIEKMQAAIKNLLLMYQEFCPKEFKTLLKGNEIKIEALRYSEIKTKLGEEIIKHFTPARVKKEKLLKDKKGVLRVFLEGSKKARIISKKTLKEAKEKIGLIG